MPEVWDTNSTPTAAPVVPPKPVITVPTNYTLQLVANQWTLVHTPPPKDIVLESSASGTNSFFQELKYIRLVLSCGPSYGTASNAAEKIVFAKKLWDVLTALRGPDQTLPWAVKSATTAVIRKVLMGDTRFSDGVGGEMNEDHESLKAIRAELSRVATYNGVAVSSHFISHAKKAFAALGIQW